MKGRVLIAAALILALLSGGAVCRGHVERCCGEVERLLALAEADGQPTALKEAMAVWESNLPLLSCVLNHDRLERVGEGLARADGFLEAGDRSAFSAQIGALRYLLEDIREYDDIRLQTLL